ncbi:hypothetical protein E4U24_002627 [Claviceps purpurea]|nr:hypothetical protein E4U24_002627 [Claviceps purpurea]
MAPNYIHLPLHLGISRVPQSIHPNAHGSFARNIGGQWPQPQRPHKELSSYHDSLTLEPHVDAARAMMTLRGDSDDHQQQHSHISTPLRIRNPERDKRTSEWVEKQGPEMFEPETSEEVESEKNGSEKDESKNLEGLKWRFQGSEKSTAVLQATTQQYAF